MMKRQATVLYPLPFTFQASPAVCLLTSFHSVGVKCDIFENVTYVICEKSWQLLT